MQSPVSAAPRFGRVFLIHTPKAVGTNYSRESYESPPKQFVALRKSQGFDADFVQFKGQYFVFTGKDLGKYRAIREELEQHSPNTLLSQWMYSPAGFTRDQGDDPLKDAKEVFQQAQQKLLKLLGKAQVVRSSDLWNPEFTMGAKGKNNRDAVKLAIDPTQWPSFGTDSAINRLSRPETPPVQDTTHGGSSEDYCARVNYPVEDKPAD